MSVVDPQVLMNDGHNITSDFFTAIYHVIYSEIVPTAVYSVRDHWGFRFTPAHHVHRL